MPTYDTWDIGIAAALFVAGVPQVGIDREAPSADFRKGRAIFRFEAEPAQTTLQRYLTGHLQVDAQSLVGKMNEYRRLIYNKERLGSVARP
jgi:hypothetical protein